MSKILVTFFENGVKQSTEDYSGNEMEALLEVVESLWNRERYYGRDLPGSIETVWEDDVYVVYKDNEGNLAPMPENRLNACVRTEFDAKPVAILDTQIRITPHKYGTRGWPEDVRVMFTRVD